MLGFTMCWDFYSVLIIFIKFGWFPLKLSPD